MDSAIFEKLTVLGEGAKYDVSCSSSGADRTGFGRIGNTACAGICHSWGADGRCISLLKVLLSNDCVYDCSYCVNRRRADVRRCTFEPRELADLTMEFYRRNYIEGLFLSSAVLVSPDHTAERMYECLYLLREVYGFGGYIHAKVIPGVSPEILTRIGFVSDRLSVNIELPSEASLSALAPQKKSKAIFTPIRQITRMQAEQKTLKPAGLIGKLRPIGDNVSIGDGSLAEMQEAEGRLSSSAPEQAEDLLFSGNGAVRSAASHISLSQSSASQLAAPDRRKRYKEKFAPAGQTTQMIIGASPDSDRTIIKTSESLYRLFSLKRVYFSAYIPISDAPGLPGLMTPPPLKREHRLYQADWLLRFYGFAADEIFTDSEPNLDYDLDPKIIWALRHIEFFPIEINKASMEELLRIPGIGNVSAKRIMRQRRIAAVKYDDLKKMGVVTKRARFFLTCSGRYYGDKVLDPESIRRRLNETDKDRQLSMFDFLEQQRIAAGSQPPLLSPQSGAPHSALPLPAGSQMSILSPQSTAHPQSTAQPQFALSSLTPPPAFQELIG
ncbi:MAG: putative DNA modification/repair radical SAM protein [Clostridiales Family XIII bacterium]|jgi:putative DNA modification/repair radical SAM protein|nr:putative DNA modification/repair radical SAM protein [Clostridiales Family XIII bacterium]